MENAIKRIQEVYLFLFDKVYLTFLFTWKSNQFRINTSLCYELQS